MGIVKDSKLELLLSYGSDNTSGIGYRITIRLSENWIEDNIPAGKRGNSFDYPLKTNHYFKNIHYTGTAGSVEDQFKLLLEEFSKLKGYKKGRTPFPHMRYFSREDKDVQLAQVDIALLEKYARVEFSSNEPNPKVAIFKEKHGNVEYLIRNRDEAFRVYLHVLKTVGMTG